MGLKKVLPLPHVDAVHPLISRTIEEFRKPFEDVNFVGRIQPRGPDVLDISVTRQLLQRALQIMQTLILKLEIAGWEVVVLENTGASSKLGTYARRDGIDLKFQISEPFTRPNGKRHDGEHRFQGDRVPTGKLRLIIDEWIFPEPEDQETKPQRYFTESVTTRLEQRLDDFIENIRRFFILEVAERTRREKERAAEEIIRRRKAEEENQRIKARARIADLYAKARRWNRCTTVRAYLDTLEAVISQSRGSAINKRELSEWAAWARQHIDSIDPILEAQRHLSKAD